MYCAKCGTQSSQGDDFCRKCGAPLNRTTPALAPTPTAQTKIEVKETITMYCSKCGTQNVDGSQFCNKCGVNLAPQPTASQSSNDAIKAQIEEARHNEKLGWLMIVLGFAFSGIGAWIGLGSTATRYFSNGTYEIYHPNAAASTILLVLGVFVTLAGCVSGALNVMKRINLGKKLK